MAFPENPSNGQMYKKYIYNSFHTAWEKIDPSKYYEIGTVYIQFPNKPSPSELGWYGTWSNISNEYAGDFFRAEGGNASAFESGEQSDAIRNITGYMRNVSETWNGAGVASGVFFKRSGYSAWYTPDNPDSSGTGRVDFDASRVVPTANENRPINKTIRTWGRTA